MEFWKRIWELCWRRCDIYIISGLFKSGKWKQKNRETESSVFNARSEPTFLSRIMRLISVISAHQGWCDLEHRGDKQCNQGGKFQRRGKVIIPEGLWLTGSVVLWVTLIYMPRRILSLYLAAIHLYIPLSTLLSEGWTPSACQSPISAMNAEKYAITGNGVFDGGRRDMASGSRKTRWNGNGKKLSSGGKVDETEKYGILMRGALKASAL